MHQSLMCCTLSFSSSTVALYTFSALYVRYTRIRHSDIILSSRLPLCQTSFQWRLRCWASPCRKIAYSITQSITHSLTHSITQLIWCAGKRSSHHSTAVLKLSDLWRHNALHSYSLPYPFTLPSPLSLPIALHPFLVLMPSVTSPDAECNVTNSRGGKQCKPF